MKTLFAGSREMWLEVAENARMAQWIVWAMKNAKAMDDAFRAM
jgi:hypothetical protein